MTSALSESSFVMQTDVPSENVTLFSRVVLEYSISPISPLLKRIINDNLANSHENWPDFLVLCYFLIQAFQRIKLNEK